MSIVISTFLPDWHLLLQEWAADGRLSTSAREALLLDRDPELLKELVDQWTAGDFSGLPPIELLPAASMPGAAGAYAISTGTIYLNQDWLQTASQERVLSVLTEELGHHLDGLLKTSDTPGDEGDLLASLLNSPQVISTQQRYELITINDQGNVLVKGAPLEVEQASIISATRVADISNGPTFISVESEIQDATGLDYSSLSFRNISDPYGQSISISLSQSESLVQGTEKQGKHLALLKIPVSTTTGTWELSGVNLRDGINNTVNLWKSSYWDSTTEQPIWEWSLDQLQQLASIGIADPNSLSFSITGTPTVSSDQQAPTLSNVMLSSKTIDISNGPTFISVESEIQDATGLDYSSLSFRNISDPYGQIISISLSQWGTLVQGTEKQGKHLAVLKIPFSTATGTWELSGANLRDAINNTVNLWKSSYWDSTTEQAIYEWTSDQLQQLASIGIADPNSLSFLITGTPSVSSDQQAPKLANIRLLGESDQVSIHPLRSIDVSTGQKKLSIEVDIKDVGLGLGVREYYFASDTSDPVSLLPSKYFGYLTLVGPGNQSATVELSTDQLISGDLNNGTFRTAIQFDERAQPGIWRLGSFYFSDKAGNNAQLPNSLRINTWDKQQDSPELNEYKSNQQASVLGIGAANLAIEVINNTFQAFNDETPPQLLDLRFDSSSIDVSTGQKSLSIEVDIKDVGLGLGVREYYFASDTSGPVSLLPSKYFGYLTLVGPGNQSVTVELSTDQLISGDLNNGTFRTAIQFDERAQPGIWRLGSFYFSDKAGNDAQLPNSLRINTWDKQQDSPELNEYKANQQAIVLGISAANLAIEVINNAFQAITDDTQPQLLDLRFAPNLDDPFVNDGQASFSITGTLAVGQTLTAALATTDLDGDGAATHTWQASADGNTWNDIGFSTELTIKQAQAGQQLRLLSSYTDGQGFSELVTTAAGRVLTLLATTDSWSYLASHKDLITAFGADPNAAALHYLGNGFKEGRALDTFDEWSYLASHGDLITTFGTDPEAAASHYVANGFKEGRVLDTFDEWSYLASHGDLITAFGPDPGAAALHYIGNGFKEGRVLDTFDEWSYLASHGDLITAFGPDPGAAALHYIGNGFKEGRALDTFDEWSYLASHGDLITAFGLDPEAAALHYVGNGFKEGRALDTFDEWSYLASHGDLITAFGLDPEAAVSHYVANGFKEGRALDTFDETAYASAYPDLSSAFGNDSDALTRHYVGFGFNEGRLAVIL